MRGGTRVRASGSAVEVARTRLATLCAESRAYRRRWGSRVAAVVAAAAAVLLCEYRISDISARHPPPFSLPSKDATTALSAGRRIKRPLDERARGKAQETGHVSCWQAEDMAASRHQHLSYVARQVGSAMRRCMGDVLGTAVLPTRKKVRYYRQDYPLGKAVPATTV